MEPRAATPQRRLEALRQLADARVPTSVMVAPVIPAINDAEIERILDTAAALGVKGAGYVLLRCHSRRFAARSSGRPRVGLSRASVPAPTGSARRLRATASRAG
jgi:DNA repair photolyase